MWLKSGDGKSGSRVILIACQITRNYLPKAVVNNFWNNAGKERTANLQTGISIDLNQVKFKIFVDHEVVTEKLK